VDPATHAAALSKAHGNAKLADNYVPGASHHQTENISTLGRSAAHIHASLTPHGEHPHPAVAPTPPQPPTQLGPLKITSEAANHRRCIRA
jgi:hypothetical protein